MKKTYQENIGEESGLEENMPQETQRIFCKCFMSWDKCMRAKANKIST